MNWNDRGAWLHPENLLRTATERPSKAKWQTAKKLCLQSILVALLTLHPWHSPLWQTRIAGPGGMAPSGSGAACTPMTGYLHCRVLTIDHTQVGSTLTNFPLLVNTTYGANAQSASCLDHVYTSDAGGTTLIPWEIDKCTPPAVVIDWVLISSVSSSVDTLFYVSYDNAGISTAQNTGGAGPTNVWAAAYQFVGHLTNTGDSTSNAHTCSLNGTVTGGAAQISSGFVTNGTAANYTTCGTNIQVGAQAVTVSGWAKSNTVNTGYIVNKNYDGSRVPYSLGNPGASEQGFGFFDGGWHTTGLTTNYRGDGLFHFIVGTYDGTTLRYYFDGSPETTLSYSGSTGTGTGQTSIGAYINNSEAWNGTIDEARILNTVLTAAQILVEWKSQKTSSTLLTVGAEI